MCLHGIIDAAAVHCPEPCGEDIDDLMTAKSSLLWNLWGCQVVKPWIASAFEKEVNGSVLCGRALRYLRLKKKIPFKISHY